MSGTHLDLHPEPRELGPSMSGGGGEGHYGRGWRLTKLSWSLIRRDRALLLFPALSIALTTVLSALAFGTAYFYAGIQRSDWPYAVAVALGTYVLNFVGVFFGVAFVAVARRSLRGEPVRARDGLACAWARILQIAGWALLTTIVSLVIQTLEHIRGGALINRVVAWILGAAWALGTFFVVPIIVCDGVGPVEAARRSVRLIRRRWGEGVTGSVAIGAIFGLILIPVVILFVIGWNTWDVSRGLALTVILIGALLFVAVIPLQSALTQMFKLVLYEYAAGNGTFGAFDERDLERSRRRRRRRRWGFASA